MVTPLQQYNDWVSNKKFPTQAVPKHIVELVVDDINKLIEKEEVSVYMATKMLGYPITFGSRYKNFCLRYNLECKVNKERSRQTKLSTTKRHRLTTYGIATVTPQTKYLNPEIQRHLDIAKVLIEEEETKLAIYNEMKQLLAQLKDK